MCLLSDRYCLCDYVSSGMKPVLPGIKVMGYLLLITVQNVTNGLFLHVAGS